MKPEIRLIFGIFRSKIDRILQNSNLIGRGHVACHGEELAIKEKTEDKATTKENVL